MVSSSNADKDAEGSQDDASYTLNKFTDINVVSDAVISLGYDLSEEDIVSDIAGLEEDAQLTENYMEEDMEYSEIVVDMSGTAEEEGEDVIEGTPIYEWKSVKLDIISFLAEFSSSIYSFVLIFSLKFIYSSEFK